MSYRVSAEQLESFEADGYLILRDVFTAGETADLQRWAQEVHDWPISDDVPYMPYEEVNASGKRVLCRTENYANYHAGFDGLLRSERLLGILEQLSGEPMRLFKEKINYKLAGSGGFAPHLDSPAYTMVRDIKHLTILIAVDTANMSNGGLEAVRGSHKAQVPLTKDLVIEPSWVREHEWTPVELEPGQLLIFGSYLAHRSGANTSSADRKALYATYNRASEGDLYEEYYRGRAKQWPPTHLRKTGEDYSKGQLVYGFGSPMLSIVEGRQLLFDEAKT